MLGTGEIAQWLTAFAVLQDLDSVPSTHIKNQYGHMCL